MTDLKQASSVLKEILGLRHEPIAVKFFKKEKRLDGFRVSYGGSYCDMIIGARNGKKLFLGPFNAECYVVEWLLKVRVPPEKHFLAAPTGHRMSKYRMVASCPLADAPFKPDVVMIDAPEQLRRTAMIQESGGTLGFDTSSVPYPPVHITVLGFPDTASLRFPVGKTTTVFNCMRCPLIGDPTWNEGTLGFPIKDLDNIVHSLQKYGRFVKSVDKRLSNQ